MSLQPPPGLTTDPSLADSEDRELSLAFQRGEKGAYQAIYDRYKHRVESLCRRMLIDSDDAQEATQETFLRVYQGLIRFNGRYQLGAWITRIATNICIDHLRTKSRRPMDATDAATLVGAAGSAESPENLVVQYSENRRVRRVLRSLPPIYRAAIVLRDFEGLSYAEMAVALQITEAQVKALLHRARKRFKQTWLTAALATFSPARILNQWSHRLRGIENVAAEPGVYAVGSSAPALCVCGGALQQIGQHLAAPLAKGLIAAAIGGSAAMAVSGGQAPPIRSAERQFVARASEKDGASIAQPRPSHRKSSSEALPVSETGESGVPSGGETEDPDSTAPPAPDASPSPEPTPEPDENSGDPDTDEPVASPFMPVVGFDHGHEIPGSQPSLSETSVDCATPSFTQQLETQVSDGDSTIPGRLTIDTDSSFSFGMWVSKSGYEIYYTGGGPLISRSKKGNLLSLEFAGSYGTGGAADSAHLPQWGRFHASLTLDCAGQSVITESVIFFTE